MANYKTYKQYDSRWGNKNYNGSSTMATAGCGPTSVAMLAYGVDHKTDPWDVAKFMKEHEYAVYGNGTAWSGIPAAMKHFGLKDVRNVADMSDVFAYLKKRYCAVFLFKAGTVGGITWTTSGHYVAVTSIKVENGKHYLYMRDSGGRNHTGRYCYETQMKGLISQVWVGYVPGNLKKAKKKKTAKKNAKLKKLNDRAIADAYAYRTDPAKYKYPSGKPKKNYKEDLGKAFPDRSKWWKQTAAGAACDVYVPVVIRAAGIDKSFPHGLEYIIPYLEKHSGKGDKWQVISSKEDKNGHYYSPSQFEGGEFIVLEYKGSGAHTFFVVKKNGKLYVAEAQYHGKTYPHISKVFKTMRKSSYELLRAYRPRG